MNATAGPRVSPATPARVTPQRPPFDAVILVGGRGARLDGADKAAVELGGQPLVASSVKAAEGARALVVVGSTQAPLPPRTVRTQEEPAGSGPAAAFAHGLGTIVDAAPWVLLLSCDVPGAPEAAEGLFSTLASGSAGRDGIVLTDPRGRDQWLLGLYRTAAVRECVSCTDVTNGSLRGLLGRLDVRRIPPRGAEWCDVDTWADHAEWIHRLGDVRETAPE